MTLAELLQKTTPAGECLLWNGTKQPTKGFNYGIVHIRGEFPHGVGYRTGPRHQSALAHRLVWVLANDKPIERGLYVCHSCDTPSCVNPAHLWVGSPQQNMNDAKAKGRIFKPEKCRRGHNEWAASGGHRRCKACHRESMAERRAKEAQRA